MKKLSLALLLSCCVLSGVQAAANEKQLTPFNALVLAGTGVAVVAGASHVSNVVTRLVGESAANALKIAGGLVFAYKAGEVLQRPSQITDMFGCKTPTTRLMVHGAAAIVGLKTARETGEKALGLAKGSGLKVYGDMALSLGIASGVSFILDSKN